MYYYGMPYYQMQNPCQSSSNRGYGYALILVLFILLVIIGASAWY